MRHFRIAVITLSAALVSCTIEAAPAQSVPGPVLPPPTASSADATAQPGVVSSPAVVAPATSVPFVPFTVTTWADNVVFHDNPGHLSAKLGVFPDNSPLTVLGRTPGGEWLMVKTADNRVGWVFEKLVESTGPETSTAPLINPTGVLVVRGHLVDTAGAPVSGVQFSVVQADGSDEMRTDAMTDADGVFYAFLPLESRGSWWISYTAISCESNKMDATCSNWTGEPEPKGVYVQLPGGSYSPFQFVWK
jgi:hypothetical protein